MKLKFKIPEKLKNMSLRTKRIMALSVCLLLLGAAIIQNVRSGGTSAQKLPEEHSVSGESDTLEDLVGVSKIEDSEEFFAQKRLDRLNTQSALTEEYETVVKDESAAADAVAEAKEMLDALNTVMACENDLESQVKALGYQDVFAALELTGEVDITVLAESLNEADVNSIATIAVELTQTSADNITIRGVAVGN